MLKMDPKSNVTGYMASNIASNAVGRNGDPPSGGESAFVAVRLDGVPLDVDGMGTSVLYLLRRVVAILREHGTLLEECSRPRCRYEVCMLTRGIWAVYELQRHCGVTSHVSLSGASLIELKCTISLTPLPTFSLSLFMGSM